MLTDNYKDHISELVEEAHAIFNATSVYETMNTDIRQTAVESLCENYNELAAEDIDRYLDMVQRLKIAVCDA